MSVDTPVPWPRFRGNPQQTGRAPGGLSVRDVAAWRWPAKPRTLGRPGDAARGIFNSAVVTADGKVFSGDASGRVSEIDELGQGRVVAETGALIDTTPLLLDGWLFASSGDGFIWRGRPGGAMARWFEAPRPQPPAFINWFEGHLGTDADGRIVAPNDNFHVYVLDPRADRPEPLYTAQMHDQTWSLACVDPVSGEAYFGNNAMLALDPAARNVFAYSREWQLRWSYATKGSVVASPAFHDGWVFVGSFDGFLYAFDTSAGGEPQWRFATGDHLYASPAVLGDGTVVQAGCDGSVYALHPKTGALKWRYDHRLRQPFRASPAVDPEDRIWIPTGDGRMLVLGPHGETLALRSLDIDGPRRQVNASPAVAPTGIVVGDSEGALHLVPWRAAVPHGPVEVPLAPQGYSAFLSPTDPWGVLSAEAPASLRPGEPLCFTLDARLSDGTRAERTLGLLTAVEALPADKWTTRLSGDRRYVVVEQVAGILPGQRAELRLRAQWNHSPERDGLRMWGGTPGPAVTTACAIDILPMRPGLPEPPPMLWFQRIAMSLPALLPSYNQIGFETLVYGITRVCPLGGDDWLYLCTGWQASGQPDPSTGVRFPMVGTWSRATGTLHLRGDRVDSELNGFATHMRSFAITCWFDPSGEPVGAPSLRITYTPAGVGFYGRMLEALGMGSEQAPIEVFGSGEIGVWPATAVPLSGLQATLDPLDTAILVRCGSGVHLAATALALVVQEPDGRPVTMNYGAATKRSTDAAGVHLRLAHRSHPARPWTRRHRVWLVANGMAHAVPWQG